MYAYIRACMRPQSGLSIEGMCRLAQVSRAGFYRSLQQKEPDQEEMLLRDRLHRIALEHRCYGSRRLTAMLKREGLAVNRKRVQRLVREDNLLAVRKRRITTTTNSDHKLVVYPNLAKSMVLNGPNQLWVADLTYIRLQREFVYLAVVLDAYSRRVIGWALNRRLKASLTVRALEQALASRSIEPGLVHHSDRGVQYACSEYVAALQQRGVVLSMSRAGNPYDNAKSGRTRKEHRQFHRGLLQSEAAALGSGLLLAGRVRAATAAEAADCTREPDSVAVGSRFEFFPA